MAYTTTMKKGYEFKGIKGTNSALYSAWINKYCKAYALGGIPLDANAVAGLITTEVGSKWNPKTVAGDYATTGSVGLGQFITKPYAVAQQYGLNSRADQENPQKNIIAICHKMSDDLKSASGDYNLAYRIYNAGWGGRNGSEAIGHAKTFQKNYDYWVPKQGLISAKPTPTPTPTPKPTPPAPTQKPTPTPTPTPKTAESPNIVPKTSTGGKDVIYSGFGLLGLLSLYLLTRNF